MHVCNAPTADGDRGRMLAEWQLEMADEWDSDHWEIVLLALPGESVRDYAARRWTSMRPLSMAIQEPVTAAVPAGGSPVDYEDEAER